MSKTNFKKVEEALETGLRRIELDKLGKQADNKGTTSLADQRRLQQKTLEVVISYLLKQDNSLHTKLKIGRSEVKRLLNNPDQLTDQDWETVTLLLDRCEQIKGELERAKGIKGNDDLIAQQRRKHITKRFNVQEKWLPLQ